MVFGNCPGWFAAWSARLTVAGQGFVGRVDFCGRRRQVPIQGFDESRRAGRAIEGRAYCADCSASGRDRGIAGSYRRTRTPAWIEQFQQRQAAVERRAEETAARSEPARAKRQ